MTKLIAGKTQNNEPLSAVLFHELIHLKKNKTKQKQTNTKVIGHDTYSDVIRQFRNVKATGVEMRRAVVCGIVTGDAPPN